VWLLGYEGPAHINIYCAWCEMPRGVSYLSAKPKSSSYFGWLFIPNILLDINYGPGLAALYHRSN
jgi:hypothetical protein